MRACPSCQDDVSGTGTSDESFDDEVKRLLQRNKIDAIKFVRETRRVDLRAAKEYVEDLEKPVLGSARQPKKGAGGGLLLVVIALIGVYYFVFQRRTTDQPTPVSRETTTSSASQNELRPRIDPGAIELSAVGLLQAYNNNEVAADRFYKGKILLVSGVVESVGKDILNKPYIALRRRDDYEFRQVQAFFATTDEAQLATLTRGTPVRIQGRCDGMFGNVMLKESLLR